MPDRSIVPKQIKEFNIWIRNTNKRQLATNPVTSNAYWQDYGWSSGDSAAYTSDWHNKWVSIYSKLTNPLTKTKTQRKSAEKFIANFKSWIADKNLLNKIKSSGTANEEDEATWHMVLKRRKTSRLRAKIGGVPVPDVHGIGRGDFDVTVMRAEDAARASIARELGADSVQFSCKVLSEPKADLDPDDTTMQKGVSRKAHFPFSAGVQNQTRWLVIFFRWYNTSYPQYAGTWSNPKLVVIS